MVGGATDWQLTDLGIHQANRIGQSLAVELGTESGYILYASDLSRARQTAVIVGKYLHLLPIINPKIREQNFGSATGKSVAWFNQNRIPLPDGHPMIYHRYLPDAETGAELYQRVSEFVSEEERRLFPGRCPQDNVGKASVVKLDPGAIALFYQLDFVTLGIAGNDRVHIIVAVFDGKFPSGEPLADLVSITVKACGIGIIERHVFRLFKDQNIILRRAFDQKTRMSAMQNRMSPAPVFVTWNVIFLEVIEYNQVLVSAD